MSIKLAINGYGRIGRNILRAIYENHLHDKFEIIAINSLGTPESNAHLTKYDSTHGIFNAKVTADSECLSINNDNIKVLNSKEINDLPWEQLGIDIVLECSGVFASKAKAMQHLHNGAKKVLISAPAGKDVDATIVYGVNHHSLLPEHNIVSNASCTTNCLAPLVMPLHKSLKIKHGLMTTIHSYTNDQALLDVSHQDLRRARATAPSMIPTKTGAAAAVGLIFPDLDGKLDGMSVRVPTMNVSLVDFSFVAQRKTTVEEVNNILEVAATAELSGILEVNKLPLVSIDFNHNPASAIFDATQTKVIDDLVKVYAWYDNEWAFSLRMLDTAFAMWHAK